MRVRARGDGVEALALKKNLNHTTRAPTELEHSKLNQSASELKIKSLARGLDVRRHALVA